MNTSETNAAGNAWLIAAKPVSLLKIVLPVLAGIAMAVREVGWPPVWLGASCLAAALLIQLMIVLLNDYADAAADEVHTKEYPHLIDPRMIPQGRLTAKAIATAGSATVMLLLLLATWLATAFGRPLALPIVLAGLLTFWMYSFPPVRLNYRGGGELLETAGVGLVLPLFAYYVLAGDIRGFPWLAAVPLVASAASSALASGLKHRPADLLTGKKTAAVLFGGLAARQAAFGVQLLALISVGALVAGGIFHFSAGLLGVVMAYWPLRKARVILPHADVADLAALKAFKSSINRAIQLTYAGVAAGVLLA